MCHRFSKYFSEKIRNAKAKITKVKLQLEPNTNILQPNEIHLDTLVETSEAEVSKVIPRLTNKSSPLDNIHISVVKACADVLSPLITRLVNLSFVEGRFPDRFKIAQVTPLLKKDGLDVDDPANYRPISNLNTISKVIERLCLARILPHVAATGRFNPL